MSSVPITVVGGGEITAGRYLEACRRLGERVGLRIADVIDVNPEEEMRRRLNAERAGIRVHRLEDDDAETLLALLEHKGLGRQAVIIATPTRFHVPYAVALLDRGYFVAVEKPYACSGKDIEQFHEAWLRNGDGRLFLLGYYALEKGLAALALARRLEIPAQYLELLSLDGGKLEMKREMESLGELVSIEAAIFEGIGTAGSLDQRKWVLNPAFGGNTVETFYHLCCMVQLFVPCVDVREVSLGIARCVLASYPEGTAETATVASMAGINGVDIRLAAAKYVPPHMHRRGMLVKYRGGEIQADFEACSAVLRSSHGVRQVTLSERTKYGAQFRLMASKLNGSDLASEYPLFREALELTLRIRAVGLKQPLFTYDQENLATLEKWRSFAKL